MGYSERSKAYRIYFSGFKKIDISKDVTFDEDSAYNKSRKRPAEELEQVEAPRIHDTTMNEETQEEDREFEEPQEPVDPPQEKNPHKRKPAWVREAIQGVMERNSYGLGYHNRQLNSINQSFPICKRNQTINTKGSRFVPFFGQLV